MSMKVASVCTIVKDMLRSDEVSQGERKDTPYFSGDCPYILKRIRGILRDAQNPGPPSGESPAIFALTTEMNSCKMKDNF